MEIAFYLSAFVTLFVIIDPIALAPLFVALTQGMDEAHRRAVGLRACLIAIALMTLFGLLGDKILQVVGISMPAFRISGGVLLFLTALDMLFERRTRRREDQHPNTSDPSVFPL
ncbi:MAG: MarC family protein, partial [Paracoccaceae bacterium]|nr:MarC family protein [Paracoccaceae bacterium]